MTLEPNEKKSQSLRRGLVLSLIGLQLVTVALILFITHVSTRHDIDKQASLLLQYALNESKEHTEGFLEPSYRNVQLTADLLAQDVISLDNKSQLEHYFLNQLKNNPEMTGIYIAKPEGDFYFVSRSNKDEKIGFMTKEISANNPGKASFYWRYESKLPMKSRHLTTP